MTRKLYKRGSLRPEGPGRFSFVIHNPLVQASLTSPPRFVVNGVQYDADAVEAEPAAGGDGVALHAASAEHPLVLAKGDAIRITFPGHLLRGANRIQIQAETDEFGTLDVFVEERRPQGDEEE